MGLPSMLVFALTSKMPSQTQYYSITEKRVFYAKLGLNASRYGSRDNLHYPNSPVVALLQPSCSPYPPRMDDSYLKVSDLIWFLNICMYSNLGCQVRCSTKYSSRPSLTHGQHRGSVCVCVCGEGLGHRLQGFRVPVADS